MVIKINKLQKKIASLLNSSLLVILLLCVQSLGIAAPQDKITTYDKYEVFFCPENSHDATLIPIRSEQGLIDYCKDLKLNIKHYSSQDNNIRFQCESKSVYRIITEIGVIDDKGFCLAKEIKWFCDPPATVNAVSLPINTYYCPGTLPKDYLNTNILICPKTIHNKDDLQLLSGGIATDSFFCDNISVNTVHYVAEDQIIAKYTQLELDRIHKEQGLGQTYAVCPSKSAYRIITYKGEPDLEGKCHVTYDVYCDPQTFLQSPFDSRECPQWSTVKQPVMTKTANTEQDKPDIWSTWHNPETVTEPTLPTLRDQTIDYNQQAPCGQIPTCGGGCAQNSQLGMQSCDQSCGGYQMLPYTGYYMMQCQPGLDCSNNGTTTTITNPIP
jgi:hypothetical protein